MGYKVAKFESDETNQSAVARRRLNSDLINNSIHA